MILITDESQLREHHICEIQCEVLEFSEEHNRLDNLNYCKAQ